MGEEDVGLMLGWDGESVKKTVRGQMRERFSPTFYSKMSLEWLMLIDILVIWPCFAQRTFFLQKFAA